MTDGEPAPRGLTVNAAFLKDIKDDNRQLKSLLDRIAPLASHQQTAANHWPELVKLLADLRDQLAFHFSLEEAYGYFDAAVGTEPRLSAEAELLRSEHTRLFARARDLADRAGVTPAEREEQIADVVGQYQEFVTAFERHEEAELRLILRGLDDDIGVGD